MNILLVDDQATVLDGLRHGIDFGKLGYEKVFTATDAASALKICGREQIEVIVTDVEMPGKSGLELLSEIRETYPSVLRIILTSHPVFSYAQEGLKLGAFDYIVQPAPFGEIENSLRRAAGAVIKNSNERRMSAYGSLFKLHENEFFTEIISRLYRNNPQDVEESISILNEIGYSFSKDSLVQLLWIGVFSHTLAPDGEPSQHETIAALNELIRKIPAFSTYACFITPASRHLFTAFIIRPDGVMPELDRGTLSGLQQEISRRMSCSCALYFSGVFRYREIGTVMRRARSVISNNISYESGIFSIDAAVSEADIENSLSDYLRHWDVLLRSGQMTMLRKDILALLDQVSGFSRNNYQTLCRIHLQLLQLFLRYFYENNIDTGTILTGEYSYRQLMGYCSSVEDVMKMVDFLIGATKSAGRPEGKKDSYVSEAREYITRHYNEEISVKAVSEYVHLNPEYFTRLFKKETGMNIKDFITDCRISMAKDLLRNSGLTVSTIASEVGYSSFSYFALVFRQITGMTPSAYRAEAGKTADSAGEYEPG